jgi:adenine C2-methylase RlmN of 23S rRNA A2503 and tRNA A37
MKPKFICTLPLDEIVVLSDGRITSCCIDSRGENIFADIYEEGFESTLNNFQIWKKKLVQDVNHFPTCVRCVDSRKNHYNNFHKLHPSGKEIDDFLSANAVPRRLVIEPTVACNLTCSSCISGKRGIKKFRKVEKGLFLDIEKLKQWISPYIKKINAIKLFNYGETFLHPHAIDFCGFLTQANPGINLIIATNVLPLDSEEKIKKLIQTQPNVLYVSLHGSTQETIAKYMGNKADFNRALNTMKKIVALRNHMGYDAPLVVWKYILFKWNDSEKEMNLAKSLAKEYGVDFLGFEITRANIRSEKFRMGSKYFNQLKNSEYYIRNIYGIEVKRKFKKVNHVLERYWIR